MPLTIANLKKVDEKEYFQTIKNWYINNGDSDGLMLRP
jgi:hypothetical protein